MVKLQWGDQIRIFLFCILSVKIGEQKWGKNSLFGVFTQNVPFIENIFWEEVF